MSNKSVCILAIGTELTLGQIDNRNAAWISAQLAKMGISTLAHWTIPDDRKLITEMLDFSAKKSSHLIVTGGLGPTSDDFTREVIAEWSKKKLIWHEPSWNQVTDRLISRGISPKESQKQQCYYPEGAKVLQNNQGTANGFWVETSNLKIAVLPGPPREVKSVWEEGLRSIMQNEFSDADPTITRSWDTIGIVESQIAEITEHCLLGSGLLIGYRVHLPYVEVKLSFKKSEESKAAPWIEKLTHSLSSFTVLRDGKQAVELLADLLNNQKNVYIEDNVSGDYLIEKLLPKIKPLLKNKGFTYGNIASSPSTRIDLKNKPNLKLSLNSQQLVLSLDRTINGLGLAKISGPSGKQEIEIHSPYKSSLMREREAQYYAEQALLFWIRCLQTWHY